jgi:hypothetical protein
VRKRSTWVAWAMLAIFGAGLILNVALAVANNSVARDPAGVLHLLDFTAFMVVGAVIVARRPDNAMGWLFSAVGLLALTLSLANEYTQYAYVTRPGALPLARSWPPGLGDGGLPRVWSHVHLHLAVVPHRSAAVAPLATNRLAGRRRPGRDHPAGRPPADARSRA